MKSSLLDFLLFSPAGHQQLLFPDPGTDVSYTVCSSSVQEDVEVGIKEASKLTLRGNLLVLEFNNSPNPNMYLPLFSFQTE